MRYTVLSVAAAFAIASSVASAAEIVVKKDGTRVEGDVTEGSTFVIVKTSSGRVMIPRSDIRAVLGPSAALHERFKADPNAGQLLTLASRAGVPMDLQKAEEIVRDLREDESGMAVEMLLLGLGLTPECTRAAVELNTSEFKAAYGDAAIVIDGEHYRVLTNVDSSLAKRIAVRMDGIFEEYQKQMQFEEKVTDRFVVKVYNTEAEYLADGGPEFSAAYFSPYLRELVAFKTPRSETVFESLYHEGMHQFLHFYVPNPPIWFDEGLAQYFESAKLRLDRIGSSKPNYALGAKLSYLSEQVRDAARNGRLIRLTDLLAMPQEEFYGESRSLNYAQAWAFTHFLIQSTDEPLKKLWKDYFYSLKRGAGQEEANSSVFGKANMQRLQAAFAQYAKRL
jgi:hypothetical protein